MTEIQGKPAGFQQVNQPKVDLGGEVGQQPSPAEQRRRSMELAKTLEAPPPSGALKAGRKGVDPLASTVVSENVPPKPDPGAADNES
jgi:hypothetical protein